MEHWRETVAVSQDCYYTIPQSCDGVVFVTAAAGWFVSTVTFKLAGYVKPNSHVLTLYCASLEQ